MKKITKSELIELMLKDIQANWNGEQLSKNKLSATLDLLTSTVAEQLAAGNAVALQGLCTFTPKMAPAKSGTSPNGTKWEKPAQKSVKISASSTLKKFLG